MDEGAVPQGYEFVRVLGSGGFGEVVLAKHLALGRLVAIKRIHAVALSDAESVARFRREAQLLATLDCPSVVRVYDLVVGPRQAHLVMEYVPGQALSDLVALGPLPAAQGLRVLRDTAAALQAAAGRGIVHRDVKPHNIFVLPDGRAKLGDFGLARAVSDPGMFRTTVGVALGTPAYYPPELGQGAGEPDARSDAYSFAVVAYETLTGRRPYDEPDAIALITAHWRLEPPDPRTMLPGLPAKGAAALLAGLAKDPARRLLPTDLVGRLEEIPSAAWPEVQRAQAPPVAAHRTAPTVVVPAQPALGEAPSSGISTAPAVPRRRRRARLAVGVGLAVVVVAGLVAWSTRDDAPTVLEVVSVQLGTDPDPAVAICPNGTIELLATVATNGAAGELTLRWTGPGGDMLSEQAVTARAGQRDLETRLRLSLSGRQPLSGPATVMVVGSDLSDSSPVDYRCPAT